MKKLLLVTIFLIMLTATGCGQKASITPEPASEPVQTATMDSAKATYFVDDSWLKANLANAVIWGCQNRKGLSGGPYSRGNQCYLAVVCQHGRKTRRCQLGERCCPRKNWQNG